MDIVPGYVFILPAVIVVGWILSWWAARWVRWFLLSGAAVVSVLCVVVGWILLWGARGCGGVCCPPGPDAEGLSKPPRPAPGPTLLRSAQQPLKSRAAPHHPPTPSPR